MTLFTDKVLKFNPRLCSDLGITDVQSAGIWGNIGGETGGFSALQEKKPTVAGSRGGYGWLQWTGPRRRAYEAWCKGKNFDPALDEANYQYLVFETKTSEAHSLEALKKTTTVEAATETFCKQNLRPGKPNLPGRINWAKQAYQVTHSQSKADSAAVTGGAVVVATGGIAAGTANANPSFWADHWHWIVGGGIAVGVVGIILVILHHNSTKAQALKGKK